MKTISVSAHFDGERILLDEPIKLEPDTKLIVTILPKSNDERESWLSLSDKGLARAYGKDEEEYPLDAIMEANAAYEEGYTTATPSARSAQKNRRRTVS